MFCKRNIRLNEESLNVTSSLESCTNCAALLGNSQEILAQCCECGLILNGPFQGKQYLTLEGKPDLTVCQSHGICQPCAETKIKAWRASKQLRAKQVA
jgi:hypothetical protein